MSRASDALNRLELTAKKLQMSIEDALSILEGKHPEHILVRKAPAIPLGKDPALADPSGISPADARDSSLTVETEKGNPGANVNLDGLEDVYGVEEGADIKV